MAICSSTFSVLRVSIVLSFLSSAWASSSTYGDARVNILQSAEYKQQINVFQGDQLIVDLKLKSSAVSSYNDFALLNITQSVDGISTNVTIILTRTENYLFNVTSVSPVTTISNRPATVLSQSFGPPPLKYKTNVTLVNSNNTVLSLDKVFYIQLISHRLVTVPGLFVKLTILR